MADHDTPRRYRNTPIQERDTMRTLTSDTTKRDARGYPVSVRMNEGIARDARNIDARAYHHGTRADVSGGTPPPAPTVGASLMAGVFAWQEHAPLLDKIAARTVPAEDRADCVQEQRIALWRARGTTEPTVFTVANRAAIDYARKHCRISARGVDRETVPLDESRLAEGDSMADVDARLDGMDTIHALIGAADLPTLDVQIMQWRIVDGESFATIGERIGVSSGAARVRHHRTIRRLRDVADITERDARGYPVFVQEGIPA